MEGDGWMGREGEVRGWERTRSLILSSDIILLARRRVKSRFSFVTRIIPCSFVRSRWIINR